MNQWQGGSTGDKANRALAVAIKKVARMRLRHEDQPSSKSAASLTESLENLAEMLRERGRYEEAIQTIKEAGQVHLQDAAKLAQDLMVQASELYDQGAYDEALCAVEGAVNTLRLLNEQIPKNERFVTALAWSLNLQGILFSNLTLLENALNATKESVSLRRDMRSTQPEAFAADLAHSLNNLGNRLNELGHREEAIQASKEAVVLYRELYKTDRDKYLSYLASSLANLDKATSIL